MNDLALIDGEALERITKLGGDNLLRQIITIFLDKVPQKIATIKTAMAAADYESVVFEAHALRSSSGNLGASRMVALTTELEKRARENPGANLATLVVDLETAANDTLAHLQLEYVNRKPGSTGCPG